MIGEILNAVLLECKELLKDTGGTILFKTDYSSTKLTTYNMPLLLMEIVDAPDTGQYPGGVTRCDWVFAMNAYNYQPNSTVDDTGGYSSSLLNFVDIIRQHFSMENWLMPQMTDAVNNYGLRMTLSSVMPADALDQDGVVLGYKIIFETISFDESTDANPDSSAVLTTLVDNSVIE